MKKLILAALIIGFNQLSFGQVVEAGRVRFDSSATNSFSPEAGFGLLFSDGANGLFHRTISYTDTIIGSQTIGSLKNNIGWNNAGIPGLKLNSLSSEDGLSLVDGALWYNSTTDAVRARINGETRTILKSGDGVGASFQANELLIGATANDSITGIPKVNNALGLAGSSSGVPTWFTPSVGMMIYEEWPTNDVSGMNDWTGVTNGSGTVSITSAHADTNHPGIVRLATSITGDRACIHDGTQTIIFGGGYGVWESLVYINNLSSASEEYDFWAGFGDVSGSGDMTDGVYFLYDRNTSVKWIRSTAANSTRTQDTSTTLGQVSTGWTKLRIEVNAAGTSAEFFVNGTSIGTNTTNIPVGASYYSGQLFKINRAVGTDVARGVDLDYAWFKKDFRTSR